MAPTAMKISLRYGSHMTPLLRAVMLTGGDILELGGGVFSTHALHSLCRIQGRQMMTIENDRHWYGWLAQYQTTFHQVIRVKNWDDAPIEKAWDVVLVDHSPDSRRAVEIERLAQFARYIIAHDADERLWRQYGYDRILSKFSSRLLCSELEPATLVLSNFEDLTNF